MNQKTQIGTYRTTGILGDRRLKPDGWAGYDKEGRTWPVDPPAEARPPFEKEVAADSPEGAAVLAQANRIAADAGLQDAPVDPFAGLPAEGE